MEKEAVTFKNDVQVKNLKPNGTRYIKWEFGETGLGVRVGASGKKVFVFMYRFGGKPRMMKIGLYGDTPPAITLADARIKVAQAKEKLEKKNDPGATALAVKAAHHAAPTVENLARVYIDRHAKPNKRSWKKDERILKRNLIPSQLAPDDARKCRTLGDLKAKDVTKRDIRAVLEAIVDRGSPIMANRTLEVVRRMFNFLVEQDYIPASPCATIKKPGKENRRDRVLLGSEIKTLWDELPKAKMIELTRLAMKFQLATAQRIGEVAAAEWREIDLDGKVWTIPGPKAKNGLPHRVPLSPLAMELLGRVKAESGQSRYLFPSPREAVGHMSPSAIGRALNKAMKEPRAEYRINLENVTPHDLRRTAASHITAAGIPRLVVSKVLNHAESGVTAVYDRHGYDNEKRQALDLWAHKLEEIITGRKESKVIPMVKKGKR